MKKRIADDARKEIEDEQRKETEARHIREANALRIANARRATESQRSLRIINNQFAQASNGLPTFQYDLAMRFIEGDGVPQDNSQARHWLSAAMTNGSIEASNAFKKFFRQ